jgi:hypothetical protein
MRQGDQYEIETLIRRLASIPDPTMRRRQLQRHILSVDAGTFAEHLQIILTRCVRGDAVCAELQLTIAEYLHHARGRDAMGLEAVNLHARSHGLAGVGWMLLCPAPARSIDALTFRQRGRPMSLGERKSVASGWDRARFEYLVEDNAPEIVDRLCANPRVQEPLILAIATRRPTVPELLERVALHPRWARRHSVREALIQNPYADTGMTLRLLPTLHEPAMQRIQHAQELHQAVRDFAGWLLALRRDDDVPSELPTYGRTRVLGDDLAELLSRPPRPGSPLAQADAPVTPEEEEAIAEALLAAWKGDGAAEPD